MKTQEFPDQEKIKNFLLTQEVDDFYGIAEDLFGCNCDDSIVEDWNMYNDEYYENPTELIDMMINEWQIMGGITWSDFVDLWEIYTDEIIE